MTPLETVQHVISDELGIPESEVTPATSLREIADSLELASVVLSLEDAFGIEIPSEDAQRMARVQDVLDYVGAAQ